MAQSYSDTEHSSSNYSSSYPSLSDSTSSRHINSDIHSYESPNFGIHPRQPSLARPLVPHTPHGLASISLTHVSNPTPQNFQSLQEYTTRLEKDHRELEKKHLLLETQHEMLR